MAYVSLGRSEQLKDIYIKGKVDPASEGERGVWSVNSRKRKTMGGFRGQTCNKNYDGRSKVAIQRETCAVLNFPSNKIISMKTTLVLKEFIPKY